MRLVKDGAVWSIAHADKTLTITDDGKTTTRRFVSAEHAAIQLQKLVGERVAAGYVETADAPPPPPRARSREDELVDAIIANPEDRAAYAVLADHLVEHDDRRGELMQLQLAEESDASLRGKVERYVAKQAARMLGPLAKRLDDIDDTYGPITWRRGFVHAIAIHRKRMRGDIAEILDELLAAPACRLVHRIMLRCGRDDLRQPCAVIAQRAPAALRELDLAGGIPDLTPLARAVPELETLALVPRAERPDALLVSAGLASLATAPFAKLRRLDITYVDPADIASVMARVDLPALRELALRNQDCEDAIAVVARSPLAAQLESLELGAVMHDDDAEALLERRGELPHLREIVINAVVTDRMLKRLRAGLTVRDPKRVVGLDDLDDEEVDDDHYDDIDE